MSNKILFVLGTGSQIPNKIRNHNGYFVRWENEGFLFDPGEGTQRQMSFSGVKSSQITKIFITHLHGDHCLGLPGIVQRLVLDKVQHNVELYYPKSGEKYINNLCNASIYFGSSNIIKIPTSEGIIFKNHNLTIKSYPLEHCVDSWGYRIQENDSIKIIKEKIKKLGLQGPVVGELKNKGRITHKGQIIKLTDVSLIKSGDSMSFIMDTKKCENAVKLSNKVDLMICESTFLDSEKQKAYQAGHLTSIEAAEIAKKANAKKLVLTHYSPRYKNYLQFQEEAVKVFSNTIAVQDQDVVEFSG